MEIKAEKKLRSLARKLEELIDGVTPQSIYDDLVQLMKSQSEYFKLLDKEFLVGLIFYIYSYKRYGSFEMGQKMVKDLFFANFIAPANENYMKTCDNCGGDGDIECGECYGSGQVDCHNCDGVGKVDCDDCGGTGELEDDDAESEEEVYHTCSFCAGTGQVECDACDGDKVESCGECRGNGRESCDYCDGTGEVESEELVYYVYEICAWSKNIYDRCELKMNTDEPTFSEDEFYRFRNAYVLLHHFDDHDELIDNLETDELYCFLLEKDDADLDISNSMKIMVHGYPEYYIN